MKKIILSSAFLVLGVFAFSQQTMSADKKADFQAKQQEKMMKMKTEYNLSDTQVAQIKALHESKMEARKAEIKVEKTEKRQQMKAKMEQNDQDMKNILTAEQYKKWQDNKQQKMAERKEKMNAKKVK